MLEALRKSATGIFAKILIGLLILSFAVWGVADVITGVGRNVVADVGGTEIGMEEFRRQYQNQLDAVYMRTRSRLTPEQARAFGIERQVIDAMIGSRAVANHAKALNLSITDNAVEQEIENDPLFQGANGQFNPERFRQIHRNAGYSEEQFVQTQKAETVREQLTDALLENVTPSDTLLTAYATYRDEERVARYFTLNPQVTINLGKPTPEELRKTYEANKSQFVSPERRHVEVLMITADDAKRQVNISDDELKTDYETSKDSFSVPEKRRVFQIPFKDAGAAGAAREKILQGTSFDEVAKASGAKTTDIDLGLVTKSDLIDPKIAEAAFSLEKETVSEVIDGQFSTVLLKVSDIRPGKVPPFQDVKEQIRDRLAGREAPAQIRKMQDQVEDNRLAGKSLKEIGDLLGITYHDIAAVDRSGNGPDGKPVLASPDLTAIIATAFASSVGVENEVLELSDDGYAWVRLLDVTASEQRPFDDVRTEVAELWKSNETNKLLGEQAKLFVDELNDGSDFATVAAKAGGEVKSTAPFKRADQVDGLSPAAVARAFAIKQNDTVSVISADGLSRSVLEVTQIKEPTKQGDAEKERLADQLANEIRRDVLAEYIAGLRDEQGYSLNQALIDQTVGIVPRAGY
ncbi:MAG: SurA N-terminal domain-containing protein [Hyphomicrobiaceae bacterium]